MGEARDDSISFTALSFGWTEKHSIVFMLRKCVVPGLTCQIISGVCQKAINRKCRGCTMSQIYANTLVAEKHFQILTYF